MRYPSLAKSSRKFLRTCLLTNVDVQCSVIFALILAATSMAQITMQLQVVTKAASAASELFRVIDRESPIDPMSDAGLTPAACSGDIEVRGVTFEYPLRPDTRVLDSLTLNIPAKKTTALVGVSGSGKSTIVGLLERWYDQSEGTICLDGVDMRELNVQWLRTRVRLVQQEPVLLSGTVFENVAHGLVGTEYENASRDSKMQLVRDACKAAFAHDFIEQLPQQYFTQIGERARMLSGGQQQRIAIARSIISNPPVLLLDEATSALDPRSEKVVQEALDNVSKSRTTLVIAHKLSTVQKADNIAVMSRGAVVEQGTHADLLMRDGVYARLVRAQSLEQASEEESSHWPKEHVDEIADVAMEGDAEEKLARFKTEASIVAGREVIEENHEEQGSEGMGYSLLKCLFLHVQEQSSLWPLYFVLGLASLCAGESMARHNQQ